MTMSPRKLSTTEEPEDTEERTGLFLRVPRVLCGGELVAGKLKTSVA
jgi:hypothetical protein